MRFSQLSLFCSFNILALCHRNVIWPAPLISLLTSSFMSPHVDLFLLSKNGWCDCGRFLFLYPEIRFKTLKFFTELEKQHKVSVDQIAGLAISIVILKFWLQNHLSCLQCVIWLKNYLETQIKCNFALIKLNWSNYGWYSWIKLLSKTRIWNILDLKLNILC